MAPKRKAAETSASEHSDFSDSNDQPEASTSTSAGKPKKAKAAPKPKVPKAPVTPLDPSLPTNTAFPMDLAPFAKKGDGEVRIAAWNVCGIKACDKKVSAHQVVIRRVTLMLMYVSHYIGVENIPCF